MRLRLNLSRNLFKTPCPEWIGAGRFLSFMFVTPMSEWTSMWIRVLGLMIVLSMASTTLAQPPDTLWTREYRGLYEDIGMAAEATSDGGVVVMIQSDAATPDSGKAGLIRYDADGHLLWQRLYRNLGLYIVFGFATTQDGGFILGGAGLDGWQPQAILRTDSQGNPLWYRAYHNLLGDWVMDIAPLPDGGFGLLTSMKFTLIRLNADGDSLWARSYSDPNEDPFGYELLSTADSGFVLCGARGYSRPDSSYDMIPGFLKTDSLGNVQWDTRLRLGDSGFCHSAALATDGSIYGVGWTTPPGSDSYPMMAKLSANGDSLWTRVWYDQPGLLTKCCPLADGGFLVLGLCSTTNPDARHYLLAKIDSNGQRLWQRTLGNGTSPWGYGLTVMDDGSYILAGDQWNGPATGQDVRVFKLGWPSPATEVIQKPELLTVALSFTPNPFNATTQIKYTLPQAGRVSLRVYDVTGREVAVLVDAVMTAGEQRVTFEGRGLASGIYFVRLDGGGTSVTRKILLVR